MKVAPVLLWVLQLGLAGAGPISSSVESSKSTPTGHSLSENHTKNKTNTANSTGKHTPTATNTWRFQATGHWTKTPCTGSSTDARLSFWDRWTKAGVPEAWDELLTAYKKDRKNPKYPNKLRIDAWLWNAFYSSMDPQCSAWDSGSCGTIQCVKDQVPAAAEYILDSFAYVNQMVRTTYDSVVAVQLISQNDMQEFVSSFSEKKSHIDEKVLKLVLDAVLFAVGLASASLWNDVFKEIKIFPQYVKDIGGKKVKVNKKGKHPDGQTPQEGNERQVWKDISNAAVAYAMISNKDALSAPKDPTVSVWGKMLHYAGDYFNHTIAALQNQLSDIMEAKDEKALERIDGMMKNGGMFNLSTVPSKSTQMQHSLKSLFFGALLPKLWGISKEESEITPQEPFILRVPASKWKCGEKPAFMGGNALHLSKWNMGQYLSSGTNEVTYWCDEEGNTFWLLSANYPKCPSCIGIQNWLPFGVLKGGDKKTLDGEKWGISLPDIINSTFGGFLQNGKKNGFEMDKSRSSVTNMEWEVADTEWSMYGGIRTPGFFNFTVCLDPEEADHRIRSVIRPPCGTVPAGVKSLPGTPNEDGFVPGWCTIHVTQYQPDDKTRNPMSTSQLAITVYQDDQEPFVFATKQPLAGTMKIDSKLPYPLYVQDNYKDGDKEILSFWYNGQWFLEYDAAHSCNIGEYDSGKREGACGFTCQSKAKDPPKKPPAGHPQPCHRSLPGQRQTTHVSQREKRNEMEDALNIGDYALELTLRDDDNDVISYMAKTNRPPGKKNAVSIQGPLKSPVACYSGNSDDDPPVCNYGDQKLDISNHDFDGGSRDLYPEFKC
ncbi:hypothetical protein N7492_000544 [Penicillium capsulatum]|uniref:Uncharacterized protein n=1 Tax=Penicillium capsulatum TaxID=69766 RepID=A0A9W9IRG6_9EURO|nr:hypothetical protein N7492_000544 [Penicillium capsulatum]